jgi:hypothetical protein
VLAGALAGFTGGWIAAIARQRVRAWQFRRWVRRGMAACRAEIAARAAAGLDT